MKLALLPILAVVCGLSSHPACVRPSGTLGTVWQRQAGAPNAPLVSHASSAAAPNSSPQFAFQPNLASTVIFQPFRDHLVTHRCVTAYSEWSNCSILSQRSEPSRSPPGMPLHFHQQRRPGMNPLAPVFGVPSPVHEWKHHVAAKVNGQLYVSTRFGNHLDRPRAQQLFLAISLLGGWHQTGGGCRAPIIILARFIPRRFRPQLGPPIHLWLNNVWTGVASSADAPNWWPWNAFDDSGNLLVGIYSFGLNEIGR